jgi:hypothetical protein
MFRYFPGQLGYSAMNCYQRAIGTPDIDSHTG